MQAKIVAKSFGMNYFPTEYTEVMDITKTLAINLKQAREKRDLTQKALGDAIGKTSQTIKDIEKGRRKPSIEVLEDLSEALGVTPGYLLSGGEIPEAKVLPVSSVLKKMACVPDEVYNLSESVPRDDEAWGFIIETLQSAKERIEKSDNKKKSI